MSIPYGQEHQFQIGASQEERISGLRRTWLVYAVICTALLAAGAWWLGQGWQADYAWRWLMISGLAVIYLLIGLWRGLPLNHPPGSQEVYPDLGLPNNLTFWRGVLLAGSAGFLTLPLPSDGLRWLPGILFSLGTLPDYIDGYLARVTRRSSALGEYMDMHVDTLGVITGSLLVVQYGQAPVWFLLTGFARYLFLAGIAIRERLGWKIHPLPFNLSRRAMAGVQMGLTMVLVWPLFGPPGTHLAAALFTVPFLLNFGRDFLYVSGTLKPPDTSRPDGKTSLAWEIALLGLRLLAAVVLSIDLLRLLPVGTRLIEAYAAAGVIFPAVLFYLMSGLQVVSAAGLALGWLARTWAVIGVCLLGWMLQLGFPFDLWHALAIVACIASLYLGSGRFSLWRPEDELLLRRAGERP